MTAIDPNTVHFSGENSFMRLRSDADGEETTVCAHWRTLISPSGPGTCLFLRSDATGGEVKLYADNIGMARWLQGELEKILNPPFADTAMPIAEAAFSREGAFRSTYREIVDSADGRIELSWSDMGDPFMLTLPPNNDDTGPWAVYSCLIPCRTATLEVAGNARSGLSLRERHVRAPGVIVLHRLVRDLAARLRVARSHQAPCSRCPVRACCAPCSVAGA